MSASTMLYYNRDIAKNSEITDEMRLYCGNTGYCMRKLLIKQFSDDVECPLPVHMCCDICQQQCSCESCCPDIEITEEELVIFSEQDIRLSPVPVKPTKSEQQKVKQMLKEILCRATSSYPTPLFFGKEVISGITDSLIAQVANNCCNITCGEDLVSTCEAHAKQIMGISRNVFSK